MDDVRSRLARILLGSWSVLGRGWWRFILVIAAMTAASGIAALVAYAFMPTLVYAQRDLIVDSSGASVTGGGVLLVALELSVPLFAVVLLLLAGALGTVASLAGDLLAGRRPRLIGSIVRGARRALPLAGASVIVAVALLVSFVLAPVLVVAGILGLSITAVVRACTTRWGAPRWAVSARWPGSRFFGILAIPFAGTVLLAVWWGLLVPATTFERGGAVKALRRSRELVSRDFWSVALSLLVGAILYLGSQLAVGWLAGLGWGDDAILIARVASQTLLVAIPVVIAAVAYQSVIGGAPKTVDASDDVRPVGRGITAATLSVALVAGLLVPVAGTVTPAWGEDLGESPGVEQAAVGGTDPSADPGEEADTAPAGADAASDQETPAPAGEAARGELQRGEAPGGEDPGGEYPGPGGGSGIPEDAFVVDSLADRGDQTPGDGVCADSAGTCTLRAAVAEANHRGGPDNAIVFSVDGTIAVGTPIDITAEMTITGAGHRVAVDGGGSAQLLRVTDAVPAFALRFLTLSNGRGDANGGGAIQSSAANGLIDSVTFVDNSSAVPGGAVAVLDGRYGQHLFFENTTFWHNSAPLGSDIANLGGGVSVKLSTFIPSAGNSLHNTVDIPNTFIVYHSLIAGACTGDELEWPVSGGANNGQPSCDGVNGTPVSGLGTFGDHGGWVNTVSLTPDSPAVDGYYGKPNTGVDARGVSRAQGCGLDLGAFELEAAECVLPPETGPWDPWVTIDGNYTNTSAFGEAVTFTTYLRSPKAGTPDITGTVTFAVDGVAQAPVGVASDGTASITLSSLPIGSSTIAAAYSGDGSYTARTSDPLVHTVQPIPTSVVLTTGGQTVTGESATFTATVSADITGGPALSGHVSFESMPLGGGQSTNLGDVAVVGGVASVGSTALPWGTSTVYAEFVPDTASHLTSDGSALHTVNSAVTSTTIAPVDPSPVFGQPVTISATVAVTAPGQGTPSGSVVFKYGITTVTAPLVNGSAEFSTDALDIGSNTVSASFMPNTGSRWPFAASPTTTATVEVVKASTSIVVDSTPAVSAVGENATIRARVTATAPGAGIPTGTVEFFLGSLSLGSDTLDTGYASITTGDLPLGAQRLTIVYDGEARFLGSTATHTHQVSAVTTKVSVVSGTGTAVPGQVVRYTATVRVTGNGVAFPAGTVEFSGLVSGTAAVQPDGTAVLDAVIPPNSAASANVAARYIPSDELSQESSGFVVQQLMPASTSMSATAPGVELGEPLRVEIDVTGIAPSTTRPNAGEIVVLKGGQSLATVAVTGIWPVVVDLATVDGLGVGTHALTLIYRNGIGYRDATTTVSGTVGPASSTVNLLVAPSGSAGHGTAITVGAMVAAPFGLVPSGPVTIYDGPVQLYSGFVAALGSGWGVSFTTSALAVGEHHLRAEYTSWNPKLAGSVTTQDTDHTVLPIPTTTTLVIGPRLVTDPHSWTVFVRADRAGAPLPSGSVRLTVDGNVLPSVALQDDPNSTGWRYATVTPPSSLSLPSSSFTVLAEFLADEPFGASSAQGTQYIVDYLPVVTLSARTEQGGTWLNAISGVAWGESVEVRAEVEDSAAAPGAPVATGRIVIAGGDDETACTIGGPSRSCVLVWPKSGNFMVTAHYEGDGNYAPDSTAVLYASIDRKTPSFAQLGIQNPAVVTGDPVTAYWGLTGPDYDEGTVQVSFGDAPGCTVAVSAGRCSSSYSIGFAGKAQLITVRYQQNDRWNGITRTIQVTPLGCYPLQIAADPGEGGTLTVLSPTNCNNGTGYVDGSDVWVRPAVLAHPANGHSWRLAGFSPALPGPGPDYLVRVGEGVGKTTRVIARFELVVQCVTVRVSPQFSTTTARLTMLSTPDCPLTGAAYPDPGRWQRTADDGYSGRFLLGSEVRTSVLPGSAEDVVYGSRWGSAVSPVTQRSASSFIADRDSQVWVLAGPRCYAVDVTRTGPGVVKTSADRGGCYNPGDPAGRWTAGTVLELTAEPDYRELSYVAGWAGFQPESTTTFVSDRGVKTTHTAEVAKYTVSAGQAPADLAVHFGTCRQLTISPVVQGNVRGAVDVSPAQNCPVVPEKSGLFQEGTEVSLHAGSAGGSSTLSARTAAFGKWNLGDEHDGDPDRTLVIDRDTTLRPSFYPRASGDCVPVQLVSNDPARTRVGFANTSFAEDEICAHGTLADAPGARLQGSINSELETTLHLNSELLTGNSLIGWGLEVGGKGKLGQAGANLDLTGLGSALTATSFACQAIEPLVALRMESGETITERAAEGSDLIMTKPAPNCPYAADAWIVGTTVELAALGDPAGYGFTGWSGGASQGAGLTAKVHLDGSSRMVSVTAAYDVSCYTLTLTHDKKEVTSYPAPNCRGTDPALNRYVGGTLVSMYGRVPGGKVWRGWVGDVVQTGKVNPAFVVMDADKSAGHRWRSKSWDEELVGGLEWFGDQAAIVAKKAVGVIALALKEVAGAGLAMVPPFALIASIGPALSLVGTILEYAGVSDDITKYLHYANDTFDWMLSAFQCAAAWSFSSSGGGGAGSGESKEEKAARVALEAYDAATTVKDTADMILEARQAYFGVAKAASKEAGEVGFAVTVGVSVASTILDTGIGWEADAKSAWTDGSVFTGCMKDSVPSYLADVVDGFATVKDNGMWGTFDAGN